MRLTNQDEEDFKQATICHICEKPLSEKEKKLRDHCNFTGKYWEAAHNQCNLQCRKPLILPVIFNSLQGYDSHHNPQKYRLFCMRSDMNSIK